LLIEVTQALIDTVGADRTGVRLSPNDDSQGCGDSNSAELFTRAATELNRLQIAFLEMRASRPESTLRPALRQVVPAIRRAFNGTLILNSDYTFESASRTVERGEADAIAFGRAFLANPDLPNRFARSGRSNEPDVSTFYSSGHAGYTDYPALARTQDGEEHGLDPVCLTHGRIYG
jgi:N-ethylmaleimide reductase